MLSVRPRELRLVIQHHEAAMTTISCSSFVVYRFKRRVGGLVTLKYAPYSSQYCTKSRGDPGGFTDQKISKIFEKLYFVEFLHNREK